MKDSSGMSLDCTQCVNIDEIRNGHKNDIRSFLSCPATETKRTQMAKVTLKDVIMSSGTNNTSIIPFNLSTTICYISICEKASHEYNLRNDFICNEKCKNVKRAIISGDAYALLSQFDHWKELNPGIIYHGIDRFDN
ncbi:hypothetical protein RF11_07123 [Thelohanellus kitauei]|uniref:Uncharacterized protein n=1 Tax=Thelohanellus kitauei TaxID=669202 RepID=A0A0C2MIT7_THEKT|nr:hypothetical protein RF11_07123 [Thelohanellus kitauei]